MISLMALLSSCQQHDVVFQDQVIMADGQWVQDSAKTFAFQIDDVQASYNIYYFMRNNLDYPYANIYLKDEIVGPGTSKPTGSLKQFFLANPETGQPLGSGLADVRDNTLLAFKEVQFKQPGQYRLSLRQYMRQSTLPGIACVGVLVQKVSVAK
jgi:gliding motility-associated lipoprotein GldH